MITRRLVLAAVLVFLVGWGTLAILALSGSREKAPPRDTAPSPAARRLSADEISKHDRPDDCWLEALVLESAGEFSVLSRRDDAVESTLGGAFVLAEVSAAR